MTGIPDRTVLSRLFYDFNSPSNDDGTVSAILPRVGDDSKVVVFVGIGSEGMYGQVEDVIAHSTYYEVRVRVDPDSWTDTPE